MSNNLVFTALGTNRPGLVSQFARLASECHCNIVDSRMAIYADQLTLSMMLTGEFSAIARLEAELPALAASLELLTVMKPCTPHDVTDYVAQMKVNFAGKDKVGTMKIITEELALRGIDLASVRTQSLADNNQKMELLLSIPPKVDVDKIKAAIDDLAQQLELDSEIELMQ
ncbi:glycine cleavage system protein R [Paraferrimonas sp. SM1919]|uniref:glycine cleavage system protein R n=1 Tax=Paraferrimonas sp. SM1919 TaxID=2662263 RepID=UPI0013D84E1B|nr:ACT domain-containing protein [Paraferrimonas sp. SM1919]